jgi:ADP-heptose:LPS heptosyltransferase
LENYQQLVARLRQKEFRVQVACDPEQRDWWLHRGETTLATPRTVTELIALVDRAAAFIGNDSGPGHLAAFAGVPTFTIFGPQLPEWFAPLHPAAGWAEGKACPYKPCSDYCRFAQPICLTGWTEPEIWARIESFVQNLNVNG